MNYKKFENVGLKRKRKKLLKEFENFVPYDECMEYYPKKILDFLRIDKELKKKKKK